MLVKEEGNVIRVRNMHDMKAQSPILVTGEGIVICSSNEQCENVLLFMSISFLDRIILIIS